MRRTFLRILATATPFLFWGKRARAQASPQTNAPPDRETIAGTWHLLDMNADEVHVPNHRVDFRFKFESGQIKGAIVNRNTGDDIPLAATALDGATLRVMMQAPPNRQQSEMPTLVMQWTGGKFEGGYQGPGHAAMRIKLKLVRARR